MNGFVLAGVAIAAFAAGAALVSFRYERELRRMARFLDQREPTGNARMTAFVLSLIHISFSEMLADPVRDRIGGD